MLPYRPSIIRQKPPKPKKLKPIPSLELIRTLSLLCENSENSYDTKNHILTLNDTQKFQAILNELFNRSMKSLERQLKILGFRLHRYRREDGGDGEEESQVRVYKWKGKKELLIDEELGLIETGLKQRKTEIQNVREQIRKSRKQIDSQIQSIILSMIIDFNSQPAKQSMHHILLQTKTAVNSAQLNIRKIINKMSVTMGNQLELYKLLIYKEGVAEKRVLERDDQGEDGGDGGEQGQGQDQQSGVNGVIEEENSGNSMVSIQMDANAKKEIKQEQQSNEIKQQ